MIKKSKKSVDRRMTRDDTGLETHTHYLSIIPFGITLFIPFGIIPLGIINPQIQFEKTYHP